jgi:hypothetical protein
LFFLDASITILKKTRESRKGQESQKSSEEFSKRLDWGQKRPDKDRKDQKILGRDRKA